MWIVYILLGTISVVIAVLILRHELKKAILAIPKMPSGESFKRELDEVNSSFFEIANDLEGKYSVHEKQIHDLEEKMVKLLSDQAKLMNSNSVSTVPNNASSQKTLYSESSNPGRRSTDRHSDGVQNRRESDSVSRAKEIRLERTRQSDYAIGREAQAMLDRGLPLSEVAKQLGVGIGELKLILGVNFAR